MQHIKSLILLLVGTLIADWGIAGFLLPNHFVDGGVTGVSMLLSQFFNLPLPLFIAVVNIPFIWLGLKHIGKEFAIKGGLAIVALSIWLLIFEFPVVTNDKLLGSIFGGIFVGAGVGLAIRGGGVLDGTEILALILSKNTAATVGEIILGLNLAIFLVAAMFIGPEPALYSVLTYFAAGKTIDFLLHGVEAYNGVMIFSAQSGAIRQDIINKLGRGVTILKGVGGYSAADQEVLYCVVTRLELSRLQKIASDIDASAFIVISPVHDVSGGFVKRRTYH